jgi:deoxyribonuclease IV
MAVMLPDGRRLGAHLPLGAGMVKAVDRAHEIGADAIQIFTDNPTAWRRRAEPPAELPAFLDRLREHHIGPVAIHAAYLVNLAGPDPDFFERSVELLAIELRGAPTFGARYVNVHIGSHRGDGIEAGIRRVAVGVDRAIRAADDRRGNDEPTPHSTDPRATLVLENSAGSGFALGVDVDELAGLASAIADCGIPDDRVAFCLDVAHAWGAGFDMSSPAAIDALLGEIDARIGLRRLVMVHLNDSRAERGSRLDRHEHLGAGRVGAIGLGHLLRHPSLAHATYVLETPGMDEGYDAVNIARARALANGEPIDPLPAEAFHLRGSARGRSAPA